MTIPVTGLSNASYEVRHKQAYDWPLVQAAAALKLDGDKATNVKIVLGHVAPMPRIAEAAARAIEGKEVNDETAAAAGEAAAEGAKPLAQNGYKVKLVAVAVKRALLAAAGKKVARSRHEFSHASSDFTLPPLMHERPNSRVVNFPHRIHLH